jgi:hypothetical protein
MNLDLTEALTLLESRCASPGTAKQMRRWASHYLDFLADEGIRYPEADRPFAREAYRARLAAEGALGASKAWSQRMTALNKLDDATAALTRRNASAAPAEFGTHRVDTITPGTPLEQIVALVLGAASSPTRRAVMRSDIGRFLRYCAEAKLDPLEVGPADLRLYRRWLGDSPSVNQLMTTANKIARTARTVSRGGSLP